MSDLNLRQYIEDAIRKEMRTQKTRENAIWGEEGRSILVASAHALGYEVDSENNILDKNGEIMTPKHKDYDSIVSMAKKDARNAPIWRDL